MSGNFCSVGKMGRIAGALSDLSRRAKIRMSDLMPHPGQHDEKAAGAPARPADLLRQIPYFAGLDAPTLGEVAHAVRAREAQPGEHILTEGKPCLGLYFVMRGQVRLMKTAADGREHVLHVLTPLSLIHISEPTRLGMISYAVFC